MSTSNNSGSGRIGFVGLLQRLLCSSSGLSKELISWSWWVMSPLLISTGLGLLVLIVIFIIKLAL